MPKRTSNGSVSPDTGKKKSRLETSEGSSAHTESEHLSNDTERDEAATEGKLDNSSVDNDNMDTLGTLDTLTLAELDRKAQGPWEAEYSYGEEADLHRHYDNCTKNPGHENFIPVDEFSIEDLPERYRDEDLVDFIDAVSDLTVRVTVKYVSERRPKTGVIGKPYPGYDWRGQRRTAVGTGWVNRVYIWNDGMGKTCKCKDCLKSSTPQTIFAEINIYTAEHVVYDESEAEHTTCHLFFDRGGRPETCEGVVTLTGMQYWKRDTESDYCEMSHYTHDLELAQELKEIRMEMQNIKRNFRFDFEYSQPDQDMLFIVSHPHGCSKQISLGRWTSTRYRPNGRHSYTYTTATCRGCSGAPVCMLRMPDSLEVMDLYPIYNIHVGGHDKEYGTNYSHLFQSYCMLTGCVH